MFIRFFRLRAAPVFLLLITGLAAASPEVITEPTTQFIAAGPFIRGSDRQERDMAYRLDEQAYGHSVTSESRWYEGEADRGPVTVANFSVSITTVTNLDYALFIGDTGHPAPDMDRETWRSYGLIHPFDRTGKFIWHNGSYPAGRGDHPVVLVSWQDAQQYAAWLSAKTGKHWQLPTELQWEKAARGKDGRYFPWGNEFDSSRLNSHDLGPFDTVPVGQFTGGKSPYGLLDMAGQVFEWTRDRRQNGRVIVKGGSWDDKGCGVCRPAARHSRPESLKHILIGFRLVVEQ